MPKKIEIAPPFLPLFEDGGIKTRYVLITGGRASGKSFAVTLAKALRLYEQKTKILYTRYTMDSAEDSIIPEFREKIDLLDADEDFDVFKTKIRQRQTGAEILFRGIKTSSGKQTAKLKSIQGITIFVVDEAEEMEEEDFDIIDRGIRSKDSQNMVILIMNPADSRHWIYKRWVEDSHKHVMYDGYPVPISTHNNVTHIHTTYLDNLDNLSENYIQSLLDLKKKDPEQYAAKIIGTWQDIKTGLECYSKYRFAMHVRSMRFDKSKAIHASFDQNVVPYAYTSLWQVHYTQEKITLYCFDEIKATPPNHYTSDSCKEIKRRYRKILDYFVFYGDASGNKRNTVDRMTDYKIVQREMDGYINWQSNKTWKANPPIKKRLEFINKILAGDYPIEIVIAPKCTTMQTDLARVKNDVNGEKLKEMDTKDGVRFQKYGHASDTLDYIVIKVLEKQFRKFVAQGRKRVSVYN